MIRISHVESRNPCNEESISRIFQKVLRVRFGTPDIYRPPLALPLVNEGEKLFALATSDEYAL